MRAKILAAVALGAALGLGDPGSLAGEPFRAAPVGHAADWRAEFDDICSKTQDAMALSSEELRSLVERCDKLKPAIDGLDESLRKVYARRLEACRALYRFVLESRDGGATG
jgi:hypothetical protein